MPEDNARNGAEAVFQKFQNIWSKNKDEEMSLADYMALCKTDPLAYASAAERMLAAIGKPKILQTSGDDKLSRLFSNRAIAVYDPFSDFYGMEDTINQVVSYFRSAAQNLEEKRQILYLLGPVGSAKSSLAERIKGLMQKYPIYALKGSPVNESPLGLFDLAVWGDELERDFGIPKRYLAKAIMSPWAAKRLREDFDGDISKFTVVRRMPSITNQVAIGRTEPGDENNQDISALVGGVDLRKLEEFAQDDTDAYGYSGGLCLANRGLLEFVEMFKAPIKVLNPLLAATQDGQYKGTQTIGAIPFDGIVLAHSNESEWQSFKGNKKNEAFLDRVFVVKVPYTLSVSQELKIYQKMVDESSLSTAPCAPGTLEMLARFSVLSRMTEPANSNMFSKLRVYDGESLKDVDPQAKTLQEYRDAADPNEGMSGLSTRWAFKTLSKVFNFNSIGGEVEANPVHMLYVLEQRVKAEQFPADVETKYMDFIKKHLVKKYADDLGKQISTAYLESYSEYGQNIFDTYIARADAWIQDQPHIEESTGASYDKAALDVELSKLEKAAGISNPKDFRNEVVNFVLRAKAKNGGENPKWTSYEKFRAVIEKKIFTNTEEMLPVISFSAKRSGEEEKKHAGYVERMIEGGYSASQVRLVTDWYTRHRNLG